MIKHTDIRIGNLLYYDDDIVEVDGIHYGGKSLYTKPSESCISHNWKDIDRFKYIDLDDVLNKIGQHLKDDEYIIIGEEVDLVLDLNGNLGKYCPGCNIEIEWFNFNQIYYIHQLQNIYYLLNNEELDLKLSYEERIEWFIQNYYESGMELSVLLETMKDVDLDNFEWYGKRIYIPKFKIEI
jgi:hypothetical protein